MKGMWLSLLWLSFVLDLGSSGPFIEGKIHWCDSSGRWKGYAHCPLLLKTHGSIRKSISILPMSSQQTLPKQKSVVAQVNEFTSRETSNSKDENSTHRPRVVFFDEARFPVSIADIRNASLQRGWDGNHCCRNGKQEYRLGWYLQQFLKLYAVDVIPDIQDYLVVDADVIFFLPLTSCERKKGTIHAWKRSSSGCSAITKKHYIGYLVAGNARGLFPKTLRTWIRLFWKWREDSIEGLAELLIICFLSVKSYPLCSIHCRLAAWHGGEDYAWWRYIVDMIDTSRVSSFSEYVLYFTFARRSFRRVLYYAIWCLMRGSQMEVIKWTGVYFISAIPMDVDKPLLSRVVSLMATYLVWESTGDNFCTKNSPKKCSEWRPNEEKCPFPVYTAFHRYKIEGGSEERRWMAAANFFEKEDKIWWEYHSSEASFRWSTWWLLLLVCIRNCLK